MDSINIDSPVYDMIDCKQTERSAESDERCQYGGLMLYWGEPLNKRKGTLNPNPSTNLGGFREDLLQ